MPHPCALDSELEGCAEIALENTSAGVVASIEEAVAANAPAISDSIGSALTKVGEWVQATENFTFEQMPFLVKEIIYFEVVSNGYLVILGILGMTWGLYAYRWATRNAEARVLKMRDHQKALNEIDRSNEGEMAFTFPHYAIPISGGATAVLGVIMFLSNIMDVAKPLVAPRLFLIEYFRQLMG